MTRSKDEPFFVGYYKKVPASLLRFIIVTACVFVGLLIGLGALFGRFVDDPAFALVSLAGKEFKNQKPDLPLDGLDDLVLQGVALSDPYSLFFVPPDLAYPLGRTLMLIGAGKNVPDVPFNQNIQIKGSPVKRGSLDMLIVDGEPVKTEDDTIILPKRQPLGRWRIAGEICDGKCYAGAMRPGSGLSHRACANLCLLGNLPAVFVAASPVMGAQFLLVAGADGLKPPDEIYRYVALPVQLEGEVERVGNVLIFKVDFAKSTFL